MTNEFAQWFIDYAGQNYGYAVETSTNWLLTTDELHTLTKEIYKKYGVDNLVLYSHYCHTCKSYDGEKPYHLDTEFFLDLTRKENVDLLNRTVWTDEDIEKELEKKKKVEDILKDVEKDVHADTLREAYVFYNLFSRVVEGREQTYNFMLVQKEFFHAMYELNDKKINSYLDTWMARIDIVDALEDGKPYQLYEI